jgi:hypothetical protein
MPVGKRFSGQRGLTSRSIFNTGLGVLLAGDSTLAFDWLSTHLAEGDEPVGISDAPFARAVSALGRERRIEFLEKHPEGPYARTLIRLLVGRDLEVYRKLLGLPSLAPWHLEPLGGKPDERWPELAALALDAGYRPRQVAEAAAHGGYLAEWEQCFVRLEGHPREDVREVARVGRRISAEGNAALATIQRHFELHGLERR